MAFFFAFLPLILLSPLLLYWGIRHYVTTHTD